VGRLSDARGRKPFLLLSFLCSGAQAVAMLLYLRCGVSLLWFFPAQARPPRPPARPARSAAGWSRARPPGALRCETALRACSPAACRVRQRMPSLACRAS